MKGIPVVGYYFTASTLDEARRLFQEGEYVGAGLTAVSTVYEPIDWAWTLRGLYDFGVAKWEEYEKARFSAGVHAELEKLIAEEQRRR